MQRLATKNINNAREYNRIWKERRKKEVNWFDVKRWDLLIKKYRGGKLIDLGCLDSQIPILAKQKFPKAEVWGLDQAQECIDYLIKNHADIHYVVGDVYKTSFPNNYFDYIVAGELIEHLERPQDLIEEAYRILKNGGILALSTPLNEAREIGAVDKYRHLWSVDKEDIKDLLKSFKWLKIKIIGSQKFPVYKYAFPNIICWARK